MIAHGVVYYLICPCLVELYPWPTQIPKHQMLWTEFSPVQPDCGIHSLWKSHSVSGMQCHKDPSVSILHSSVIKSYCFILCEMHIARAWEALMPWHPSYTVRELPGQMMSWRGDSAQRCREDGLLVSMSAEGQYILMQTQWAGTVVLLQES